MKITKTLLFASSLFTLSLTACGANEAPIAGKNFSYQSIGEISVDEGFYNDENNFNGKNKDEFGNHFKVFFTGDNAYFSVGEVGVSGFTLNGQSVKPYDITYVGESGLKNIAAYTLQGSDSSSFKFYKSKAGENLELEECIVTLGSSTEIKSNSKVTYYITHTSVATVGEVKYSKTDETLTFPVSVTDTVTVNEESTVKNASFSVVWKKA